MVTRLKPRSGSFEESLASYEAGDFSRCLELLSQDNTSCAAALRTRALARLGDLIGAIDAVDEALSIEVPHEAAAEFLALKCNALEIAGRSDEAESVAIEARARCYSAGNTALEAELLFARTLGSRIHGNTAVLEHTSKAVLKLEESATGWMKQSGYRYSLAYWRARTCDVRASLEHDRGNHVSQAEWMRRSFDEYDRSGVTDRYFEASMLANYAELAADVVMADHAADALARADSFPWNPSLSDFESRVYRSLAVTASNAGDQIGALRHLRRSRDCAATVPLQIQASLDRCALLRQVGESVSAREELEYATRLSKSVDWETMSASDQRQLLHLSAELAAYDGPAAEAMLRRYDRLTSSSKHLLSTMDDRFRGEQLAARAAIMRSVDRKDRAVLLLLDALETFTSGGYATNAASVAADLADLTGEPHYVELARKQCIKQPNSLLAMRMSRYESAIRPPTRLRSVS